MSAVLKPEEILDRLARDTDKQVASWAARVDRRAADREVDRVREVSRLLEPFVAAGLVEHRAGGYAATSADVFSLVAA